MGRAPPRRVPRSLQQAPGSQDGEAVHVGRLPVRGHFAGRLHRTGALRGGLLHARTGGKPDQAVQVAASWRPAVVHKRAGEPVSPRASRRRLQLALAGSGGVRPRRELRHVPERHDPDWSAGQVDGNVDPCCVLVHVSPTASVSQDPGEAAKREVH